MQLPKNTPSPTPVIEGGSPPRSQEGREGPPLNVTPEHDHSSAALLSPVALRVDDGQHRNIFSMISPLTNAPTRAGRRFDAMYMDGRDAPSGPAPVIGYDPPVPSVYPVEELEVNTSRLVPPVPGTLREPMPRLGMRAEYIVRLVGPVVGIQTRWLPPHDQSSPDNMSTFSSWTLAARHYQTHYAGNTVCVVSSTTVPIRMPRRPITPPRPVTPPAGSNRNPIEVSSASPKKKRLAPKKKHITTKVIPAPSKKNHVTKISSARTRIKRSLKRPSPIPSTPSASPPRQRRRHHSPQRSGSPSATHGVPANEATARTVNSEIIEISSESESSNGEAPAVVRGRSGFLSVVTPFPTVDVWSESEDELPTPAFMFRTLAGASPSDMYDSDSPSEATPVIAATPAAILQRSPHVLTPGPLPRILPGASPDDMYDSDSPSEAAPSISMTLAAAVQHPSGFIDDDSDGGNVVDALADFDSTPLSTQGTPAGTSLPNRVTHRNLTPTPNRVTHRNLTPTGFPLTQPFTHRRFLTPTLSQTLLRNASPGSVGGAVNSPNDSPSPFAHLSQAELDTLLEDQLDSLR